MKNHTSKAVLAAACMILGGLAAAGCSRSASKGNTSSITTTGQVLNMTINNLGNQPIAFNVNTSQSFSTSFTLTDNTGRVTSLSSTAVDLSVSSDNPSVATASKDSQNTVVVSAKGVNGDAIITVIAGYQGARPTQSFSVRVSGASGNNTPGNTNYELKADFSSPMPINVNKSVDITISYRDKNVSNSTWIVLPNNAYSASLVSPPAGWPVLTTLGSNQLQFAGTNTTGKADISVNVTGLSGVPSFITTISPGIDVQLNASGGTGNNVGTVYNNIVLSASGSPATGVPFTVGIQVDKGSGLTSITMANERVYARIKNPADLENGRATIDADGNLIMLNSGVTVDVEFDAMGAVQNLTGFTDERWNLTTVSNTLSFSATGNIPQTKLFFRYLRGAASAPGLMKLGVWDPQTATDVTANVNSAGGLTFSDINAFEFVNATDDNGVVGPHLKIKKFGRFWIQATLNGKSTDKFYVLVTPYGDRMTMEGNRYLHDTHFSAVRTYRHLSTPSQFVTNVLTNLTRCGAGNIGTTSLFLEDVGNGSGKTMPTMTTPDSKLVDADGTVWGVYSFVSTGNSGSQDIADCNYLGSGPNPFDPNSSANKWPQDTVFSRFWSGTISSNGVFRLRLFKAATVSGFRIEART